MRKEATAVRPVKETTALRVVSADEIFERMNEVFDAIPQRAYGGSKGAAYTLGSRDWLPS